MAQKESLGKDKVKIYLNKKERIVFKMIDDSIMELDNGQTYAFSIRLKMSLLPGNTFFKKMASFGKVLKVVKGTFECELVAYNDPDAHTRAPVSISVSPTNNDECLHFVLKKKEY